MKNLMLPLVALIAMTSFSCQKRKTDIDELVNNFAGLECRAIALREERFELANKIRSTQDTLLEKAGKANTSALKAKLQSYNQQKEITLQQSLSLADSIQKSLKDMMKYQLPNEADKMAFNDMLNKVLQQKGCVEK